MFGWIIFLIILNVFFGCTFGLLAVFMPVIVVGGILVLGSIAAILGCDNP